MSNMVVNFLVHAWKLIIVGSLIATVGGCSDGGESGSVPDRLTVSVLPDQDAQTIRARYTPLLDYISKRVGIPYTLHIPDSYQQAIDLFSSKKSNLALFGGYTYVIAHQKFAAVPVVLRDIDGRFRSLVIVRKGIKAKTIHDLKGKSFSFGSELSTSGHLMPRYFFGQEKIVPEEFFSSVSYSGAHDKTAYLVQQGKVDAGAAHSGIILEMFQKGLLRKNKVKVLWRSPVFPDYVWAASPDMDRVTITKIQEAFLSLNRSVPEHVRILDSVQAGYFLPATHKIFQVLENAIRQNQRRAEKDG